MQIVEGITRTDTHSDPIRAIDSRHCRQQFQYKTQAILKTPAVTVVTLVAVAP